VEHVNVGNGHFAVEGLVYVVIFEVSKWNWRELGGFVGLCASCCWLLLGGARVRCGWDDRRSIQARPPKILMRVSGDEELCHV